MTSTSKQHEVVTKNHDSLVKKKQSYSYNRREDNRVKVKDRHIRTSSSEVHKFNTLTFLACGKFETLKFGKMGMIPQITQIVHKY